MYDAYALGLSMIGPGVKCADVFNAMMALVQKKIPAFKRGHFGHSLSPLRGEDYPLFPIPILGLLSRHDLLYRGALLQLQAGQLQR